jgi:hypothetical protein
MPTRVPLAPLSSNDRRKQSSFEVECALASNTLLLRAGERLMSCAAVWWFTSRDLLFALVIKISV